MNFEFKSIVIPRYNDDAIEVFTENLIDYIENELNPYIFQIDAIAYESEGGESVVADFPCAVCGKNGVSQNAEFYPVGFFLLLRSRE